MSHGAAARLHAVTPQVGPRRIAEEVVRFAELDPERQAILLHVGELLDGIAFGSVVIVQQDGAVIQIETSEKIRLP